MMRHISAWYDITMSQIQLVYGSLTTAIAVLLSVEIGASVLLVGAQVIAEYERIGREPIETSGQSMKLEDTVARQISFMNYRAVDLGTAPLNFSTKWF
jgi:membrane protein